MYSAKVLDHFHHPRHAGETPGASAVVEAQNPACGDVLKLWVTVDDKAIQSATFMAAGCVPAIACGSWLAEWIEGKSALDLPALTPEQIVESLGGLPPASKHAAVLACEAVRLLLKKLL
jgi:nitrogen fixation NifU-like protein